MEGSWSSWASRLSGQGLVAAKMLELLVSGPALLGGQEGRSSWPKPGCSLGRWQFCTCLERCQWNLMQLITDQPIAESGLKLWQHAFYLACFVQIHINFGGHLSIHLYFKVFFSSKKLLFCLQYSNRTSHTIYQVLFLIFLLNSCSFFIIINRLALFVATVSTDSAVFVATLPV